MGLHVLALLVGSNVWANPSQTPPWTAARSSHFEVYSQAGTASARATLATFEQLHEFFDRIEVLRVSPSFRTTSPLRIVGFRSVKEYKDFQLRPNADAYYVAAEGQAYIVVPELPLRGFTIAAHEYAHYYLQAVGLKLPAWLNEGLAEFFSTLRVTDRGCSLGGILPQRMKSLDHDRWLSLEQLLTLPDTASILQNRQEARMFYAESWALTDMLIQSPAYAERFRDLAASLNSGAPGTRVLPSIYRKPLEVIASDWRTWASRPEFTVRQFPRLRQITVPVETSELSDIESSRLLADLLMASGKLDHAASCYLELARRAPADPGVFAALGTVALRNGNQTEAIRYWREAFGKGIKDADLCYRFALLAEEAGLPADEIRRVLERVVLLKADFDDASYKLALLENNAGNFAAAVKHLRAMHPVSAARAYGYWSALSYASMELGERTEAEKAAQQAIKSAQTASDRARAAQLAYMAETDLVVQFAKGADGQAQLVETRVPHGTADWNPFIEPSDRIQQTEGQLREVRCADGRLTGFLLETAQGNLALAVPNPSRVLMRNGPAEFTCGPQSPRLIKVQYAAAYRDGKDDGVVRGVTFP
jgi:tetratricopeptide (TPR) repeat protein